MSAAPRFEPVSWLTPAQQKSTHARLLDLISEARDIAGGAAEVLALLHREDLDADFADDNGEPLPLLMSPTTRAELVRMAATSLNLLVSRLMDGMMFDAQRLADGGLVQAPAAHGAELARLIPDAPCAGQMLTDKEAADLARLHDLLTGKAVQP